MCTHVLPSQHDVGKSGVRYFEGSQHLDLSVGCRNMDLMQTTLHELQEGYVIKDAVGGGLKLDVARII